MAGAGVPARRLPGERVRLAGAPRPGRRVDRDRRDRARLPELDRGAGGAARQARVGPRAHLLAVDLRLGRGPRHQARDPGRPAVGVHDPGGHRRLDADPPLLDQLPRVRPRLRPLLQLPQLLRLLHAAAGPGGQLRAPDRRLGLRRLRLLRADQLLVPAEHGDHGRHEGLRDQRDRRRRAGARGLLHLPRAGDLRLPAHVRVGARAVHDQRGRGGGDLPADPGRGVREVRPAAAPHLAPRRDGGPHPGLRPDPRGDHGHRGRLPDRPHAPPLHRGAHRRRHLRLPGPGDADLRGDGGARGHGPEADHRLLDDQPDRLHGGRRLDRRLRGGPLPPDEPRVLQGASVHGGRLRDRGDGRHPEHRPDGRLSARPAVHVRALDRGRPGAGRLPRHLGLLLQGRDPRLRVRARRLLLDPRDRRLRGRLPDRHLRLPDRLPGRLPRAMSGGSRARAGAPGPRRAAEPDDGREGGHGRRLPRPRAPDRRAGAADGDRHGGARPGVDLRRLGAGPRRRSRPRHVPGADLRGLAAAQRPPFHRGRLGRARGRRGARPAGDRNRLLPLRGRPPDPRAPASQGARRLHLPGQQVVLRRALRRARLPAADRDRPLRERRAGEGRRAGDRRRDGRRRSRGRHGRSRRPVGVRARLRALGGGRLRRPGPLLPDRQLMRGAPR